MSTAVMSKTSSVNDNETVKTDEGGEKKVDVVDNSPKIALFELISHLRITLQSRARVETLTCSFPAASLVGKGTYLIEVVDSIASELRVWHDEPNDTRYLLHECAKRISFHDLDGYLSALVSDFRTEVALSLTLLREPNKLSLTRGDRCYDPQTLGFPAADVLSSSVLDERLREILSNALQPRLIDGRFAETMCFDYPPRARSRRDIMNHAIAQSGPMRELFLRAARAYSADMRKPEPDIKSVTGLETVYPTVPFNLRQGVFDTFPFSGYHLRYEIIATLNSFKMNLQPIATSDLIKATGSNTNKSSWLGQLSTTTYEPSMASEITALLTSYLTPGQILLEVDLSDLGDVVDMRGVAALSCMMMTMYDVNSTFSNVTEESVRVMQEAIAEMGLISGVLEPNGRRSQWPLNRVDYRMAGGRREAGLLPRLRVHQGRSGMNERQVPNNTDRLLQLFVGVGRRINYVVDHDDIEEFKLREQGYGDWTLPDAVAEFASKCKNHAYLGPFFKVLARRLIKFFVRLNQHLKYAWYNPVRDSAEVQNRRNYRDSSTHAIRHPISGRTILHLIRCLDDVELVPTYTFEETLSIYSGLFRSMIDASLDLNVLMNEIRLLRVANEYTARARMDILNTSDAFIKYVIDISGSYNELDRVSSAWFMPYLNSPIGRCFNALINRRANELVPKGVLHRFVARIKTNQLDQNAIEALIREGRIYMNVDDIECAAVTAPHLRGLISERRFNSTMFGTVNVPLELHIPIPFKFSHVIPSGSGGMCVSIDKNPVDISLRKSLKITELPVSMVSFDERAMLCPDDYTPHPLLVSVNHVRGEDIRMGYSSINDFFGRINEVGVGVLLVCNPLHSFVRLV